LNAGIDRGSASTAGNRLFFAGLAAALFVFALFLFDAFGALGNASLVDPAKLNGLLSLPLLLVTPAIASYSIGDPKAIGDRLLIAAVGIVGFAAGLVWTVGQEGPRLAGCRAADASGPWAVSLTLISAAAVAVAAVAAVLLARRASASRTGIPGLLVRYVVGGVTLFSGLVVAIGLQAAMHPATSCPPPL
jgi:hypothetical protein